MGWMGFWGQLSSLHYDGYLFLLCPISGLFHVGGKDEHTWGEDDESEDKSGIVADYTKGRGRSGGRGLANRSEVSRLLPSYSALHLPHLGPAYKLPLGVTVARSYCYSGRQVSQRDLREEVPALPDVFELPWVFLLPLCPLVSSAPLSTTLPFLTFFPLTSRLCLLALTQLLCTTLHWLYIEPNEGRRDGERNEKPLVQMKIDLTRMVIWSLDSVTFTHGTKIIGHNKAYREDIS